MTTPVGPNWAGTYEFAAARLHTPSSVDELAAVVASAPRIRALGTRHSFTGLADSAGDLVSVTGLPTELTIDADARTVTVSAGMRYGEVAVALQQRGWALHNMGSLPHISVAGAIATGTHGSGNRNGNLATAVSGLEFVSGRGELITATRAATPAFAGMVVALGALGVVTRVTLDIEPTFDVRQDVYLDLPWDSLLENFDEITGSAYSVSVFMNWLGPNAQQLWLKTRVERDVPALLPATLFGSHASSAALTSPTGEGNDNTTVQGGVAGPWSERLPHFRLDRTPSNGDEIQSEFFVDRAHASAALSVVRELGERIAPLLLVTELRTVAADELWLSMAYGRPSLAIHFTWKNQPAAVAALLPDLEAALAPFGARPHWGKVFTAEAAQVTPLYDRLPEFAALTDVFDPDRQFRNALLERVLGLPL